MRRKTLITILFAIILTVIFATYANAMVYCKYDFIYTTSDKSIEDTLDKTQYFDSNKTSNTKQEHLESSVSRSSDFNRSEYINVSDKNSTDSAQYVDTYSEKVLLQEEIIHGVKVSTYNNVYYDGYCKNYNSMQTVEIDASMYNGNTDALKLEAINNVQKYDEKINNIVEITNEYRNEANVNNLVLDKDLCIVASVRALEMSYTANLSHTRPDGSRCFTVFKDLGISYDYAGENIGDGFKLEKNVCAAWKDSESHYKNIISKKYTKIGIGVSQSLDGKYYWVQIFSN